MGEGKLEGCALACPRHGAKFDVTNGAALSMPAVAPIRSYPVKVENGAVFVAVD
ncbi:MAG: Rieske 2Fe-2S domain-containing protein [Candidatus Polarisedimenticolia bacterium]